MHHNFVDTEVEDLLMMTIILISIFVFSLILVATERLTNMNKAASAIFAGTLLWVLYICFGSDFVSVNHLEDYQAFLHGSASNSDNVKDFIWSMLFLPGVGRASEVVFFLLASMTIVEILHNNGCFDFLNMWLRTRNSRVLLWKLVICSFLLSANLDNISATVLMLTVTNSILPRSRDRIIYGAAVVLAVNFGGVLTVIGDPMTLVLWNKGAVTATAYTLTLLVPSLIAMTLPTYLISRKLNETVEVDRPPMPYRGDDTNLNLWQRLVMFFVGIGGLWFIPTFHNLTHLSPFLGAFCVLSILWIVNEIFNRNLMSSDRRIVRSVPRQHQYSIIQLIIYVVGIMFAVDVMRQAGVMTMLAEQMGHYQGNVWIIGVVGGIVSVFLDNFAVAMTLISIYDVTPAGVDAASYLSQFVENGPYWPIVTYASALGGSILTTGSVAGVLYMQAEHVGVGWYLKHVGVKVLIGGLAGLAALFAVINL